MRARRPRGERGGRAHMSDEKLTPTPKWLFLLLSYLLPPVGIILGIRYRRKDEAASRDFGAQAIAAAVLGLTSCAVLYAVWFIVLGAAWFAK